MKSINKALIYRDLKYSKWFIPILSIVLLWINMDSYLHLYYWSRFRLTTAITLSGVGEDAGIGGTAILACIMIIMASSLFSFDRNVSSYSFAASMPFTKKEVIISKWLVGFYNVFFAYFVLYIMINVLLIISNCWKECFWLSTFSLILNLLLSLCLYGFALLLQSINGTAFVGGLLSLLFAFIPYTFVYFLYNISNRFFDDMGMLSDSIKGNYYVLTEFLDCLKSLLGIDVSADLHTNWFIVKIIIYFVALIVMFFISIKIFNKSRLELNGRLITVKSMKVIYKIVMSYFAGVLVHLLLCLFYGMDVFRIGFILLVFVIISVPFYFLIDKVIKIYNHRYA